MANTATYVCQAEYSDVRVNGVNVMRLFGPTHCSRASAAKAALSAAFTAGDDFEFRTPSWWSDTSPYAVVTVKSAKISQPSTWYASDKRFIVAATADDLAPCGRWRSYRSVPTSLLARRS